MTNINDSESTSEPRKKDEFWWIHPNLRGKGALHPGDLPGIPYDSHVWVEYSGESEQEEYNSAFQIAQVGWQTERDAAEAEWNEAHPVFTQDELDAQERARARNEEALERGLEILDAEDHAAAELERAQELERLELEQYQMNSEKTDALILGLVGLESAFNAQRHRTQRYINGTKGIDEQRPVPHIGFVEETRRTGTGKTSMRVTVDIDADSNLASVEDVVENLEVGQTVEAHTAYEIGSDLANPSTSYRRSNDAAL